MDKTLFDYKEMKLLAGRIAILTIFQGAMIIVQAYALADAISSLFGGDLFRDVIKKLIGFLLALLLRRFIAVWKRTISFQFAAVKSNELREKLLQKLFHLGPRFVKEEGSGQTITLVMDGLLKFRHYLEINFIKLINTAIIPTTILLVIFYVNIRSAIILLLALPILIVFMILLGVTAKKKADRQYESYHLLSNHFVDSLRGLETLKYLGLSKPHITNMYTVSENYRRTVMDTLKIAFLSSFAMDFFTMLSIATVAVFLGLGLINGTIELQIALTLLILAPEYFLPIRELGANYHATLDGKNAGKKIGEILSTQTPNLMQVQVPSWSATSTLKVKGVNIQYQDNNQTSLKEINLTVDGAKKIGIIGGSGAGKSTLIDILSGFLIPSSGEFHLNDVQLSSLFVEEWQKQISYIPQHPFIFNDTIVNNIRFYHPRATKEEVKLAARHAGLVDLMEELPDGMDTIIGDGGRTLSGGQEQRIVLARAFLGNRPVIILDEPTAHLDIETEAELKPTMLQLFNEKLVFFSTHRLHWMLNMDQILVLDNGQLVEMGTHGQLMACKGHYYQLVHQQMEGVL
ncbi:thiol reductant ABC exporter subunit CydD [Neobacillus sp. MM2021_6]|uniref:thiol reductant ABC exporter subunit CydD n=1 Tax=Bacillaceae TaxID=186817 RepID=UPI001409F81E|nr:MULTISPECIES: thiol reductant ABC exporter subunit CydD [Bacillaceae]MBO0958236.1 thiol reductant ABC exporter subunit CydD [Neobacillus sp. MM2021_6]NHC17835.1 thiol reductant ABC exporter subunit CydD [Bacillus sp. MM2020_4]